MNTTLEHETGRDSVNCPVSSVLFLCCGASAKGFRQCFKIEGELWNTAKCPRCGRIQKLNKWEKPMTWQELDARLRGGATMVVDSTFGPWLEENGQSENISRTAAKVVMRRDLIVVKEKRSDRCYAYRSKYSSANSAIMTNPTKT